MIPATPIKFITTTSWKTHRMPMMDVPIPGTMRRKVTTGMIMKKDTQMLIRNGSRAFGIPHMRFLLEIIRIGIR